MILYAQDSPLTQLVEYLASYREFGNHWWCKFDLLGECKHSVKNGNALGDPNPVVTVNSTNSDHIAREGLDVSAT